MFPKIDVVKVLSKHENDCQLENWSQYFEI